MSTGTATAPAHASPWNTEASSSTGGNYERPPAGLFPACCVGLIDLGTHNGSFNGQPTQRRKIYFVWELTAEKDSQGESFLVGRDFTWSLNSQGKLRPFLGGWLGRQIADAEQFDLSSLVKQPCMVTLAETQDGKHVNVAGCARPSRGLTIPPMTLGPFMFHLSQANDSKFDLNPFVPDFLPRIFGKTVQDEIRASHEWGKLPPF